MMPLWLEIVLAIVGVVAAIGSATAAWLVWDFARKQTDPRLFVNIEQIQDGSSFFGLVIKNVGSSPAFQVSAKVDTRFRPVTQDGVNKDVKDIFSHTWPMISPGQVISFTLNRDKVYEERNSGSRLFVDIAYSKTCGKKAKNKERFDVTPSWKNGQLLSGPSVWREIDTRIRRLEGLGNQMQTHLASIAQSLNKDSDL